MSDPSPLPAFTDVLVVGAGPVGLTLAAALAVGGVDTVLVDQQAEGANTSRAAVVHARTLEMLDGLGVSAELVRLGVLAPRFSVRDRDRVLISIDFSGLPTRYPYTLMIPQNTTELVLLDRLHALGGRVYRPHQVTALVQDADGVTATTAAGQTIRAAYAVGTDGMHSTVREQAGIGFVGDAYPQSFVLADAHLDWSMPDNEAMIFLAPAGLVVVAPLPGGRHRVVATVRKAPEHPDRDDVQGLLASRGPARHPARVSDVAWSSRFHVHHRLAEVYRAGRVLLAGDAAHVHSPAGGQGMNTGIQDAITLAGPLAAVLRGGAAESELDRYQAQRRPVAEGVVAFTNRITRLATIGSPPLQKVRNGALRAAAGIPAVQRRLAMNLSELSTAPHRLGR